jgi:hypothetical protein
MRRNCARAKVDVQKANDALAAAEAEKATRQSALEFAKADFERGEELIKTGQSPSRTTISVERTTTPPWRQYRLARTQFRLAASVHDDPRRRTGATCACRILDRLAIANPSP